VTFDEWAHAQGIVPDDWELYEVLRSAYEGGWAAHADAVLWEEAGIGD
jgi:hypothetical protein